MTVSSPKTSRIPRRILVAFGIGVVLGAAGYVFGRSVLPQLIGSDALEGVELRWSDAMAALKGALPPREFLHKSMTSFEH